MDAPPGRNETRTTTCYMCACRCGIRVHLRDGELRYIDGNPRHPLNHGVICAKGASGIMKQHSPARLTRPLRRRPGAERGAGDLEPISWDEAYSILEERLARIRATDPRKFALFTGRDQMQALTGLFARQFGTPNYAAHGGFCSVNMAAGMIYTIGGSFWEFGGPDLDRAKLFVMIGTAEDHHSNPLKVAISKFKRSGGRFVSVNPVRTGYSAIADEWIPIRPGTDGALLLALVHEIIATGFYDREFVARYTNGGHLIDQDPASERHGLPLLDPESAEVYSLYPQNHLWWDRERAGPVLAHEPSAAPELEGAYVMPDGTPAKPAFELLKESVRECTPEWAQALTGIPAATIRRLAREMGETARHHAFELPVEWTDCWGTKHATVTGRPVAFHAMRGLCAHSNGFHAVRSLAILMSLLGTIDRPGGFRHKAPYPRAIPPSSKPPSDAVAVKPGTPLPAPPLGWPASPDDLFLDADGRPGRVDKAFSWEYPLSVHGLMHNVITNAWRGDPYRIDTLMIFMSNMAWNSAMNPADARRMLNDRDESGEYRIPFVVVCDAFQSETTAFADLVLPDTTYLERHDVMSLLDRPISEFDGPTDSVRVPVVPPAGECRPFQEVLIELATRLALPGFVRADGSRKYRDYPDFIVNFESMPGCGFLSGWRGREGDRSLRGEPNPRQWEMYAANDCVHHTPLPESMRYMRNWNRPYLRWAVDNGQRKYDNPLVIQLYSEVMQEFRLAAQGRRPGRQPPEHLRARIERYFAPLPFWYPPLEAEATDGAAFPLAAVTQRPMAMYHSWDSQNAWLRQIHSRNWLFVNTATARAHGIADGAWMWVESPWGKVRCMARHSEAVEPGTVWTWNAIGKAPGAWALAPDSDEAREGFLLNHLITDELPGEALGPGSLPHGGARGDEGAGRARGDEGAGGARGDGSRISNSDPVTGQAGWYDVRVRIRPAEAGEPAETSPRFEAVGPLPGTAAAPRWLAYFAGRRR